MFYGKLDCSFIAHEELKDFEYLLFISYSHWQNDLPKGTCVYIETSIDHPEANLLLGGVRGIILASRYLIEPCNATKSKLVHLARVDTK